MKFIKAKTILGVVVLIVTNFSYADPLPKGGTSEWVDVESGRLKARAYSSAVLSENPVLIVVLHGDVPNPNMDYHYIFAQLFAEGPTSPGPLLDQLRAALGSVFPDYLISSRVPDDIVVVGLLRPGYSDYEGDTSSGELGMALADNYTPEVIDAVTEAINKLKTEYSARTVILVGHSGGATIVANVLGLHPEVADGALLVACNCDPVAWRTKARAGEFAQFNWEHPYKSLSPLDLASGVSTSIKISLLSGAEDNSVSSTYTLAYAEALEKHGVHTIVKIASNLGHDDIVFTPLMFDQLKQIIELVRIQKESL